MKSKNLTSSFSTCLWLALCLVLLPCWLNGQETGALSLRFFDSQTGLAVHPHEVEVFDALSQNLTQRWVDHEIPVGRSLDIPLPVGRDFRVYINADRYQFLSTRVRLAAGETVLYEVHLDPFYPAPELDDAFIQSLHRATATLVTGFVSDENGRPLPGVCIFTPHGQAEARTNANGYFLFYLPVDPAAPGGVSYRTLLFEKAGYITQQRQQVPVWPWGDWSYALHLQPGTGAQTYRESDYHDTEFSPQYDQRERQRWQRLQGNTGGGVPGGSRSNCIPASIRVGRSSSGGLCCTGSCPTSQVYSIQNYVKHVLPHEWLVSWNSLPNMIEGYKAASVAIRSYGIWYVNHPASSYYDICSNACCQVCGTTTNSTTNTAVNQTDGWVVKDGSQVARSEYSSENNNKAGTHCSTGWTSGGYCNDGQFGRSNTGTPCYSDPPGTGYIMFGHGRGMSQFGTARWASGRQLGSWCQGNPYNGPAHGYGTKNWQQIVNHYYPYFSFVDCASSGCPATTTISTAISSGTHVYKASNTLNANNAIYNGANVTYQGGNLVRMTTGFHARPGSIYKANLNGCN